MAKARKEEQRKAPILRFKGFTDDWEQRQLGEVETVNPSSSKLPDYFFYIDLESVQSGILVKESLIKKEDAPCRAQRILKKNDILFQSVRPYQKNNYIVTDDKNSVASTGYIQLRSKNHNQRFIFYFLHNDNFVHSVLQRCTGTTYPAISPKDFSTINVFLSNDKLEEKQIGNFFKILDNLITLYERKVKLLSQVKKYFLDNLFAEKEYPNLRFKGFTDAWEQRKLGEILKLYPFKQYIKKPQKYGNYKVIQQGSEPIVGYANGEPFKDYANVILFGDHTLSLYNPHSPFFIATDGVKILGTNQNFEGNFLNAILERYKPKSEGYKRHYRILKNQKIYFPTNSNEQSNLGNFFELLDRILTLYEDKQQHLTEIKKTLLNTMFI